MNDFDFSRIDSYSSISGSNSFVRGTQISTNELFQISPINFDIDLNTQHKIINCANPILPQDVATKFYVDQIGGGGQENTMSLSEISTTYLNQNDVQMNNKQLIGLPLNQTQNNQATSKKYVDDKISNIPKKSLNEIANDKDTSDDIKMNDYLLENMRTSEVILNNMPQGEKEQYSKQSINQQFIMDNVMSLVNSSRVENGVVLYNNCFDSKDKIIQNGILPTKDKDYVIKQYVDDEIEQKIKERIGDVNQIIMQDENGNLGVIAGTVSGLFSGAGSALLFSTFGNGLTSIGQLAQPFVSGVANQFQGMRVGSKEDFQAQYPNQQQEPAIQNVQDGQLNTDPEHGVLSEGNMSIGGSMYVNGLLRSSNVQGEIDPFALIN